ncbi:50S ribosomal protein L1 [Halotydeus destructor]|nr:50S ribosomal protein L1 [Halotydeus destructor]
MSLFQRCASLLNTSFNGCFQQERHFAARRGKRIKAAMDARKRSRAKAVAAAALGSQAKKWVPKSMLIDKTTLKVGPRRYKPDGLKQLPSDNVFFTQAYVRLGYSIEDIVDMHRETMHSTMLDQPDALLSARIELDLRLKKKNKFLDSFEGFIDFQHRFGLTRNPRIVVIAKTREDQDKSIEAGAIISGHNDIIKQIEKATLKPDEDFDCLICHSDSLLDLASARGLLRKHFPNKNRGNFGTDVVALVDRFKNGFEYKLNKDEYEFDFGSVELPFARLSMDKNQIKANLTQLLKEIDKVKPTAAPGQYYYQVVVNCEPSTEDLRCKHWELLDGYYDPYEDLFKKDDDEEDNEKAVSKKN